MFYKPDRNDARIEWISKDPEIRPLPAPPWDDTVDPSADEPKPTPAPKPKGAE